VLLMGFGAFWIVSLGLFIVLAGAGLLGVSLVELARSKRPSPPTA